jgi:hypothetical protein
MLNENRFLGTFRGHNTRTMQRTTENLFSRDSNSHLRVSRPPLDLVPGSPCSKVLVQGSGAYACTRTFKHGDTGYEVGPPRTAALSIELSSQRGLVASLVQFKSTEFLS